MDNSFLDGVIESILFVSGEPVKISRIAAVLGVSEAETEDAAKRICDKLAFERRGIRLLQLDASLQLCSSPEYADYIRLALESRKPPELSAAALEVLSIIAYFQPVTKAYIEQIRGVDSSYTVGLLVEKGFVVSCGRLSVAGRPMIYKTTYAFLRTFGLSALSELPELPHIEASDDGGKVSIQKAILELRAREEKE
jgi:segregation and condensation protein B